MSVVGHSRHFDSAPRTSALLRSADIADRVRQVRKVPKAGIGSANEVRNLIMNWPISTMRINKKVAQLS
jgi:hypothetical protein